MGRVGRYDGSRSSSGSHSSGSGRLSTRHPVVIIQREVGAETGVEEVNTLLRGQPLLTNVIQAALRSRGVIYTAGVDVVPEIEWSGGGGWRGYTAANNI